MSERNTDNSRNRRIVAMDKFTGDLEIFHQVWFPVAYDENYKCEAGPIYVFREVMLKSGIVIDTDHEHFNERFVMIGYL